MTPKRFKVFAVALILLLVLSCAQRRIRRYESILEPKVGKVNKTEIDRELGRPVTCITQVGGIKRCEYRTTAGRNRRTADVYRKSKTMRIDVSPFEEFDVLHLYYDSQMTLKEWEAVVIVE